MKQLHIARGTQAVGDDFRLDRTTGDLEPFTVTV